MNPYAIIGIVAVWLATLAGVGWWQERAGEITVHDACVTADNTRLTDANAKIQTLEDAARKRELSAGFRQDSIATQYEERVDHGRTQRAADVAAAYAGTLLLRYAVAPAIRTDTGTPGGVAATPGGSDGQTGCQLPAAVTASLYAIADDANDTTEQLTACQAVIVSDRVE